MKAEANVQAAPTGDQRIAGLQRPQADPKGEAARKFAGVMASKGGDKEPRLVRGPVAERGEPKGKAASPKREREEGDTAALSAEVASATPKREAPARHTREDGATIRPAGERPATVAAPPQSSAGADPAATAAFAQALDRVHADTRASSETQLTMSDGRWAAQAARIVAAPDGGGVSLTLDLNQGEQHDQAATRELRRRLEARGIRVASIDAGA